MDWPRGYETTQQNEHLWNLVTGCTEISPGCDNCMTRPFLKAEIPTGFSPTWHRERLDDPLKWAPRIVFVAHLGDLFHHHFTDEQLDSAFEVMMQANQHIYQILTKRTGRLVSYLDGWLAKRRMSTVPGHIRLGASVELDEFCWRVDDLRRLPAYRYVAAQPLLGHLPSLDLSGVRWLMTAGEFRPSPNARPSHPDWFRYLRDKCLDEGVGFVFKTRGSWTWDKPADFRSKSMWGVISLDGEFTPRGRKTRGGDVRVYRVDSKDSGRTLDGQEWNERVPEKGEESDEGQEEV